MFPWLAGFAHLTRFRLFLNCLFNDDVLEIDIASVS